MGEKLGAGLCLAAGFAMVPGSVMSPSGVFTPSGSIISILFLLLVVLVLEGVVAALIIKRFRSTPATVDEGWKESHHTVAPFVKRKRESAIIQYYKDFLYPAAEELVKHKKIKHPKVASKPFVERKKAKE